MLFSIFADMETIPTAPKWSENLILVDANYIDQVAFHLIINFERMIGRRIPQADIARWIDCIALDGGLREGDNQVEVVLLYDNNKTQMDHFLPANITEELHGKAFKDHLGEFSITAISPENMVEKDQLLIDVLQTACSSKDVKRIMVVPNAEQGEVYEQIRHTLHQVDDDSKRITVFTMQPLPGGNFRQEILGYSLMSALGIKANEITEK